MEVETYLNILKRSKIILIYLSTIVKILMLQESISIVLFPKRFKSISQRRRSIKNTRKVPITLIRMIQKHFKSHQSLTFIIHYFMIKFLCWNNLKQQLEDEQTQLITKTELLRNLFDKSCLSTSFLQFTPHEKKFKLLEAKILPDMIKPLKWISYQFLCKQVQIKMLFLQVKCHNDNKK